MPRAALSLALVLLCSCGGDQTVVFGGPAFTSDPPPAGPLNGKILVTDNGDDTVAIFDPATGTAEAPITVGFIPVELEGPHHLTVDPAGQFIYLNLSEAVAGSGTGPHGAHGTGTQPGYTLKLSAADGRLVGQTRVDPNPGDLTISADGATLYVTHYDLVRWTQGATSGDLRKGDANLVIIDTATMTIRSRVALCPAAHGVRLSADGRTLYSTCGPDEIAVVDLGDLTAGSRRVALPGYGEQASCSRCPYALAVAPDGTVWVSSLGPNGGASGRGGIDVYDPARGDFDPARSVTLCGRALFAAFTPGPSFRALVPEQACGAALDVIDPATMATVSRLTFTAEQCVEPHMIELAADGGTGWLVCEGDHVGPGSLVTVDVPSLTVRSSVAMGVFPDGLATVPPRTP